MYFALYSENYEAASNMANNFSKRRIYSQIKPDGTMPEEIARTRPLFYSIYNLHAMFVMAHLAKRVDVDIWETENKNSRLRKALDFLVPYTDPKKAWPNPTIGEADRLKMFAILQMADKAYPDKNYLKLIEKLPLKELKIERSNLAFPLMR